MSLLTSKSDCSESLAKVAIPIKLKGSFDALTPNPVPIIYLVTGIKTIMNNINGIDLTILTNVEIIKYIILFSNKPLGLVRNIIKPNNKPKINAIIIAKINISNVSRNDFSNSCLNLIK